jgi:hypothetical protein
MNGAKEMRYFESLKPGMPDKEKIASLKSAWESVLAAADRSGESISLSNEDLDLLRGYAKDRNRAVRNAALDILIEEIRSRCEDGPVTWEELESWMLDPEEDIRHEAMYAIGSRDSEAYELCWTDRVRCARMIGTALERYIDYSADGTLWALSRYNDEWFDVCWAEAGRLVDLNQPEITDMLSSGYIGDVIHLKNLGPDDPRIGSWIEGDRQGRKLAILRVARWLALDDGRFREIVEALAKDGDHEIAAKAGELLASGTQEGLA